MNSLYIISGKVIKGAKRGKSLGFPTANINIEQVIPEGIYASEVIVDNKTYQAATFIGTAKTFKENEYKAESYIINFDQKIYGKQIRITLFKKLRENIQFSTKEKLIEQMKDDVLQTLSFFSNH